MEFIKDLNIYLYREVIQPTRPRVLANAMGELANNGYGARNSILRNTPDVLHTSITRGFGTDGVNRHEVAGLTQEQAFDFIQALMEAEQTLQTLQLWLSVTAAEYRSPRPGRAWTSLVADYQPSRDLMDSDRALTLAAAREVRPELGDVHRRTRNFMPHVRLGDIRDVDMIYGGAPSPYIVGPIKGHITQPGTDNSIAGSLPSLSQILFAMETY